MSWIEKINSGIIVTCGDGESYEPHYVLMEKSVEYNIAEFEFIGIEGTLVKRSKPKGRRYSFEFIFQGENHLDEADKFEVSAKDPRAWKVFHPVYGDISVQPTGLTFDPTGLNTTKITGDFIETISEDYPRTSIDPTDNSKRIIDEYTQKSVDNYAENVNPSVSDVALLRNDIESNYALGSESVMSAEQSNAYFQLYNTAITAINNAASNASAAANLATQIIMAPSVFTNDVKSRLQLLISQYEALVFGFEELLTPNQKKTFEMNGGSIIAAMANAAVNPIDGDYANTVDVLSVIETVTTYYNTYIEGLNNLQTLNNGNTDSYIPDFDSMSQLGTSIGYVVSNLMDIALNAKKERSHILAYDSNVILLAHRFYGLDQSGSNIDAIINHNNIKTSELLLVEAGRKIVYYV